MNASNDSTTKISEPARIEQLLQANETLRTANAQLQEQLASLSALYASLAAQHASDALVPYGEGKHRHWLSARSIRVVWLVEETTPSPAGGIPTPTDRYAVQVDELRITEYLPLAQAQQILDGVAETLNRVLQPPE